MSANDAATEQWVELGGRVAAWKALERHWMATGYPPLAGTLQTVAWTTLSVVFEAAEGFCTIQTAHLQVDATLAALAHLPKNAVDQQAAQCLGRILQQCADALLAECAHPATYVPAPGAGLLACVAQAAQTVTFPPSAPAVACTTHHNVVLGSILHGGDEIWAAAALLVARAERCIYLQVWAYYRRAEGAKHLMGALAQVLLRQSRRRADGEIVRPIDVVLLTGYLDEDIGLAHHTGGLSPGAYLPATAQHTYAYRIFPFPVDPALMRIRVVSQRYEGRGIGRSKSLVVDGTLGLLTSANVQGSHHRISCDGVPLHDVGWIMVGDFVRRTLLPEILANIARGHEVACNHAAGTQSHKALAAAILHCAAAHTPLPLGRDDDRMWCAKRDQIRQGLVLHATKTEPWTGDTYVALIQPPRHLVFTRSKPTPYQRGVLAAIRNAVLCIDINHCNIDAAPMVAALKDALRRGVAIRLLAAEGLNDDVFKAVQPRRRHIFDRLVAFKRRTQAPGQVSLRWQQHDHFGRLFRNSHVKAIFIDSKLALVGSVNLDAGAWRRAGELTVVTAAPSWMPRLHRALFRGFWDAARRHLDVALSVQAANATEGEMTREIDAAAALAEATPERSARPVRLSMQSLATIRAPGRFVDACFQRALTSTDVATKVAYLCAFNKHFAPRITTEEAALERLALKHIRLSLPQGSVFVFNVCRDVTHRIVEDYAPVYVVEQTLVDPREGLRAYLLKPRPARMHDTAAPLRVIIAYEGTTLRKDAIHEQNSHPTGRRSATDPLGLGFRAFAASRARLLSWSDAAQQAGHKVTLLGFSLGGVQASRHWHALNPQQRRHTRLVTFAMPGLDRATAHAMAGLTAQNNVRHFRVRLDPFSKVGAARAPGRVFRYAGRRPYPSLANHTYAYLSEREIDGLPLELQFDTGRDDDPLSPRLDRFRRFWGLLRPAR